MRRYAKPMTVLEEQHSEISEAFDVEKLLDHCGTVLQREVRNLLAASSKAKLDATQARDLVAYTRLLHELKSEQKKELSNLTDSELEALAQQSSPAASGQNRE